MCQSVSLGQYLEQHEKEGRFLAAIGCGPIVLAAHGIAMTKCVTAYPRCEGLENLKRFYKYVDDTPWMEDVQLLTSPGPGTAIDFSLKISEALVEGSGEILIAVISDILRRAGIEVSVCGLCDSAPTKCSKDVVIKPETSIYRAHKYKYDVVIIPGGLEGAKTMAKNQTLGKYLAQHYKEGRLLAAICCGPLVLAANQIAAGCRLTSYPARKPDLEKIYKYVDDEIIVQDGKLLTSRGPGTAMKFALKICEIVAGNVKASEVAKEILMKDETCCK
uniref:DJ-1/PfpI domain-containing protein n=1 Tax=Glossina pallidipes TaxID=7398 RepID=A0A1A9ZPV2_GLOPL